MFGFEGGKTPATAATERKQMHPLEGMAGLMDWASKNSAYNLKFIPEEKLGWKPAPTANSAFEIVKHVCGAVNGGLGVMRAGTWGAMEAPLPASLAEAQQMLETAGEEYAAALRGVDPATLGNKIMLFGHIEMPIGRAVTLPVIDMVHHHGQFAYIQALLGDTDFHFREMGT